MAATTAPLIWDVVHGIGGIENGGLGALVEYFDEEYQLLYLNDGLKTMIGEVTEGHWKDATLDNTHQIELLDGEPSLSAWDHPLNGQLFGVGIENDHLIFYRYLYARELTQFVKDGSWRFRNDSQITQLSLTLSNPGETIVTGESTLFNPGARVTVGISMGGSRPYPIGVAFLDEIDYDAQAATFSVSGRNTIGYRLNGQTFNDNDAYTGNGKQVVEWIFRLAGVSKYLVDESTAANDWIFAPESTFSQGLQTVFEVFVGWAMTELPDGTIVVGYPAFIQQYQTNSVWQFLAGTDVVKRRTRKNADAAFTLVRVTGIDADGNTLAPITLPVRNFDYWALGASKTKHVRASDGMTQEQLRDFALQTAADLANIGVGETFTSPMRPWILVGDIASISDDGSESEDLGIITSITHRFGESGYFTDFSVDSGGVATSQTRSGDVYTTRSASVNGYNRRQDMADLIGAMSKREIVLYGGGGHGTPGTPAGFGEVTATVDANTGTPSVDVETSGPDTAKNFAFAFHNLKGQPGAAGAAAGFGTPAATVDANTGTPSVTVTASGPDTEKVFTFAFHNLKGAQGDPGATVYNLFVEDSVTSAMYQLIVESGRLELVEVSSSVDPTEITLIDTATAKAYVLGAASGRIILTEV